MCKLRLLMAIGVLLLMRINIYAQESQKMYLSIDNLYDLIETNNKELKTAKTARNVAQQDYNVAQSNRLPDLNVSATVSYNGNATIMDRDFTNSMSAQTPHLGNSVMVNLYQPIYSGGAITGNINLAKSQSQMADIAIDNTRDNMKIAVISCYLNLFKCRNLLKVYDENIILTEKLIQNMHSSNEQGIVLKNDITRYELRLSTLKFDRTTIENNIKVLNYNICSHLSLNPSIEIIPDSTIINQLLPIDGVEYWKNLSQNNSLRLKTIHNQQDILKQSDKITRSEYLPHVGIVAGNTLEGPITYEVPPIDKNINYWWVGINVSYNISSLFKTNKKTLRNKLELTRLSEHLSATSEDLNREIEQAYILYTQAHQQLSTQLKNVELATENYRIVDKRFNNQLALLTDMLDASTAKLDAETRLINAKINTIYYYYQLKFISSTL